jgi:hypothetical protein
LSLLIFQDLGVCGKRVKTKSIRNLAGHLKPREQAPLRVLELAKISLKAAVRPTVQALICAGKEESL